MLVYLNGEYLPDTDATISVHDRGFLFADGVYEVVRVYDGRVMLLEEHLARLRDGLRVLRIEFDDVDGLDVVVDRLLDENELRSGDASVYIQVTRGAAPRKHSFPADSEPTVYAAAGPFRQHPDAYFREGVEAITAPDERWSRCDVKSIALLPNVLANQRAKAAGTFEALLVRDGVVIEGSHSNLFGVFDGTLVTYPASNYILPGITRAVLLDLAAETGIPAQERPIYEADLFDADELFLSGTTTEVMPVVGVDGRRIADGRPGPTTLRLQDAYRALI